jgi:catechol 2,3-dioxygenase-like lactoylglutathione lyase family enzyme
VSALDHVSLGVSDLAASRAFYEAALAPLGITTLMELPDRILMGAGRPFLVLVERTPTRDAHVAFTAADNAICDAFHAAALAAGGVDNGAPGPRPQVHPGYYAAFALDPDGNNIEAVHLDAH